MKLPFNEAKATQATACLLEHENRRMNYVKLIKLLYIADREALFRWGRPITTDCYFSMDKGPVLSRVFDLITEGREPGIDTPWFEFISAPSNFEVSLLKDCPKDELSQAEEALIAEIHKQYGHMNQWQLVRMVHKFDEWRDPQGSSIPINYGDILRAGNKNEDEIRAIREELSQLIDINEFLPTET
jgi:uncharacterized phage-associated protein